MGKHKQSKRERKFAATGGIKGRLENGGTIVSKGKQRGKKRAAPVDKSVALAKQQKRNQKNADEYKQQQKAVRDAEDFMGRDNLGEMDVNRFFANLEEELTNKNNENDLSSSEDDDSSDEEEREEEKVEQKQTKKKKSSKKENEEDEASDSDDDSSDDEEPASKTKKMPNKSAKASKKPVKKDDKSDSDSSDDDDDDDDDSSSEDDDKKASTKKQTKKDKATPKAQKKKPTKNDDDSDSESDDDDIEAAEARMKAEMKRLESADPEFHEFLQENEESLLEFGEEGDEDDEDEDEEDEAAATKKKTKQDDDADDDDTQEDNSIELTAKMLQQLSHGAFDEHGIKSLKKLLKAYKSACKVATNTEDIDDNDNIMEAPKKKGAKQRQKNQEKTYRIESSQVFDRLMMTCLGRCHEAFYFHLLATDEEKEATTHKKKKDKKNDAGGDKSKAKSGQDDDEDDDEESDDDEKKQDDMDSEEDEDKEEPTKGKTDLDETPLDPRLLERAPKWAEIKPLLNTFMRSTLHLITESKEPDLLAIVLKSLDKYVRYLTPFPRIADALLKTLTGLWSAPLGDASADYQVVRLNAFLRIRQMALTQPFPFIEACLKKTYLAYARRAKFGGDSASIMTNALPTLTFMGNCLVELYSLDHSSSYQHAFVYIRQLALLLRAHMQKKTKEAAQQVYCWQFMHCLKLWVAILSACCKQAREGTNDGSNGDHLMRELVYPLTEIIMGTARMMPAPARHVPLRFHCIRLCQQLAASSEKFIPTTSLLMPVLDLKELNTKPKKIKSKGGGATTRGVQLPFLLKLSKDDPLRTAEEQEAVMAEVFKLLNRELDLYRYSPGFPEFQFNVNQRLKKFMKNTKNSRWRAYARGSVDVCERQMDFAVSARCDLSTAPKDVKTLECIRPPNQPPMGERYAAAVEKENKEWTSLLIAPSTARSESIEKASADDEVSDNDDDEEPKEKKTTKRAKKRKQASPAAPAVDDAVMEIEDTVKEGVDWSSDDEA